MERECNVLDLKFAIKQVVQKINQQVLAELLAEETLEAPVGKGVDVSTHNLSFWFYKPAAKINFYFETCKKNGRKFPIKKYHEPEYIIKKSFTILFFIRILETSDASKNKLSQ